MRNIPVKSVDEQAVVIIVKHRELMVNQRTQVINALRGTRLSLALLPLRAVRTSQPYTNLPKH
jgi:hypothetical protein